MFHTHQARLPRELALAGITDRVAANRYLNEVYWLAFNAEFEQSAIKEGTAFVLYVGQDLDPILSERFARTVGHDNCVGFVRRILQIPADHHCCHYVKAKVSVLRCIDGSLAILHGPRKLADFDQAGQIIAPPWQVAA